MDELRLIDANALKKTFENAELGEHSLIESVLAAGVYAGIENAPTIDAVPVVHGHWLRENIRPKSYLRVCSMCIKTAYFCGEGCSYKYCPHCGAQMDKEATNDEP